MQLSEILSKPVLSLYDGTNEGFVINACFNSDLKKLKYLLVSGTEQEDQETIYIIDVNNIFKIGQDAVMIKNNASLELATNLDGLYIPNNPINSNAYTVDGISLGSIKDITLSESDLTIQHFDLQDEKIPRQRLASFSHDTIIFQPEEQNINVKKYRPTFKKEVITTPITVKALHIPKINEDKKYKLQESTIQRLTGNTSLLLGRKLTKHIQTQNGELIAKKDSRITPKVITTASHHQKLRELALYSE